MRILSLLFFFLSFLPALALANHIPLSSGLVPCNGIGDCDFNHLIELFRRVISFLIMIAIALSSIAFAYAGFLYLTSAGNEGKVSQAHGIFGDVLWGIIIALAAWLIVNAIAASLLNQSIIGSQFWFLGN
jgi:hypothetical protein